jgi:hypothetical protein
MRIHSKKKFFTMNEDLTIAMVKDSIEEIIDYFESNNIDLNGIEIGEMSMFSLKEP